MPILPPYFTTLQTNSRNSKPKSKSDATLKHEKWLKERGLLPTQIEMKKRVDVNWKKEYTDTMKVDRSNYVSSGMSGNASSTSKRDIMTNLHKEPEHVRKAILDKASRVMPLFNKGGLQYATPDTDMSTVGSKSRRG
jgi:hypothetical protein